MDFNVTAVKQSSKIKTLTGNIYKYYPFGIVDVKANTLQDQGYLGNGVKIAVLDTGIFPHQAFGGRVVYRKNFTGVDGLGGPHGTHVTGTIGAGGALMGVAPRCTFYDLQILSENGGNDVNFAAAIDEAIRLDVDIVNMSIGSPDNNSLITSAVKRAYAAGLILVAAAGNSGDNTIMYPGALDECISVANLNIATDQVDSTSSSNKYVDVCAPGDQVLSTIPYNAYAIYSGTSMACPHVSGMCALYLTMSRLRNPFFNKFQHRAEVMKLLKDNLLDIGPIGFDNKAGYGEVRWEPSIPPYINYLEKSKDYYYIV